MGISFVVFIILIDQVLSSSLKPISIILFFSLGLRISSRVAFRGSAGSARNSNFADEAHVVAAGVHVPPLGHPRRPPRDGDGPGQAVLLGGRGRRVDPAEIRDETTPRPAPLPNVLALDVVSGGPELEPRPRPFGDLADEEVALLRGLDGDQRGRGRRGRGRGHELALLLGLDPAHALVGDEVAAAVLQLGEAARAGVVWKKTRAWFDFLVYWRNYSFVMRRLFTSRLFLEQNLSCM